MVCFFRGMYVPYFVIRKPLRSQIRVHPGYKVSFFRGLPRNVPSFVKIK